MAKCLWFIVTVELWVDLISPGNNIQSCIIIIIMQFVSVAFL